MDNWRKLLESFEIRVGERVEAVVVGPSDLRSDAKSDENIPLSREDGLGKLDKDFDSGFGGDGCNLPSFYAWTKSYVCFAAEYDTSFTLECVPRHPAPCEPRGH